MGNKKNGFFAKLKRKFKMLSVIITLIIHLSYIAYLAYSLNSDVGIKAVNVVLIIGTSVFLAAYLIMTLIGVGNIKKTKKFYKRFKLVTKLFTSITAIYSLITASTVSPYAMILPVIGAAFLLLRIVIDIIVSLIAGATKKAINSFKNKRERRKNQKDIEKMDIVTEDFCEITDKVEETPISDEELGPAVEDAE